MTDAAPDDTAAAPTGRRGPVQGRQPSQDELPIRPRPTVAFRLVKLLTWTFAHTIFATRTSGTWALRQTIRKAPPGTPIIYVANHYSMVDGPLLAALIPAKPRIHILAAGETLTKTKWTWRFAKSVGGVFPVDRNAAPGQTMDFDAVYKALRVPKPIALLGFIEGKCGAVEGQVDTAAVKAGMARFAMNTGAIEIPVGISGTSRLWFRRRIKVKFGPPIQHQPDATLNERVADQVAALNTLIEPYQQHFGPKLFQKLLPQSRKKWAGWRAEREGWNAERLAAKFYHDSADVNGSPAPAAVTETAGPLIPATAPVAQATSVDDPSVNPPAAHLAPVASPGRVVASAPRSTEAPATPQPMAPPTPGPADRAL